MSEKKPRPTRRFALVGLLAGALFFAVGWLLAVLLDPPAAPHAALGATVVDLTPPWLKDFAVETFGTNDKVALFVVMGIVSSGLAALAGLLAGRRRGLGVGAVLALAALCALAAAGRPDTGTYAIVPAVVAAAAGIGALELLLRRARPSDAPAGSGTDRRRFVGAAVGIGAGAAIAAGVGSIVARTRTSVESARADLALPEPTETASSAADELDLTGTQVELDGMPEYVTPNDNFYRIDTALSVPQIDPSEWQLRVHGLVDQEITLSYDELADAALTEAMVTLTCVSNPIGGSLAGNATWLGLPIRDILARAGVQDSADMVLSRSADGWTAGTPLEALTDDRDSLLAIGMNGEPLPVEHGFPVRMVVPGLYGYVSATKWVTELKVTRFADDEAYWTPRGWSERGPVKTASRVDVPQSGATVAAGEVRLGGTAWAQHRGITRVQVQIDDGQWQDAELASTVSTDTWRQWSFTWADASPGRHAVRCRAWDDEDVQTAETAAPAPNGASGYHVISLEVE
ncbi:molybdopterin-dependent oxidoreductase [Ruania alba]|uniref:DMSO/TMAO reductase YedYZ, molybdopterin-dependent catalytic subunit n=1 Tax=Ruania alba TaxID=648782 RepID=A0A1H5FMW1_9MICO|nr:molybdopterin-dependent oxidoreductase [Ruania alba]SEE04729.1 DMSO/TMAO reductase YedYZ, molybdopterin-dependent catalytic subunit [Ruania alba]